MLILFKSDGKALRLEVTLNWRSLRATLKAIMLVAASILTFLATPEIHRLGMLFGLWK